MGDFGLNLNLFQAYDCSFGKDDVDAGKTDGENRVGTVTSQCVTGEENVTIGDLIKTTSLACETPELYPAANITSMELQERYESLMNKLTRARGRTFSGKSIMFDLYAMMDLIQQITQRLRNVMRELRRLENTTIYANIKAQAEVQREAAIAGAVAGGIMCLVQLGVVVIGMGYQLKAAKGFAGKNDMMKTATNVENMANGDSRMVGRLSDQSKFAGLKGKMGDYAQREAVSSKQLAAEVKTAKNDYVAAQTKYNEAQQVVANGGELPKGTSLKQLKADAEQAGLKYEYKVAQQVDLAHEYSIPMDTIKAQTSADAKGLRKMAVHGVSGELQQVGGTSAIKGIIIQQVGMAVGSFLQQIASSIREIISSKATELQAEQKLTEEQFDQIKDFFSLMQGVIQKSIDLLASVIQKESSVLEQIFQHI